VSVSLRFAIESELRLSNPNSTEMRHSVTTPTYLLRHALDFALASISRASGVAQRPPTIHSVADAGISLPVRKTLDSHSVAYAAPYPKGWLPLYTLVTFRSDVPYSAAKRKSAAQNKVLEILLGTGVAVGSVTLLGLMAWRAYRSVH
jgi:kynurenine 3-monooxygenase